MAAVFQAGQSYKSIQDCGVKGMSLQDNLRTLRKKAGYTQAKDFAENVLKMSYSTYMGYETRGVWPSEETLIKIADALETSVDTLLGHYEGDSYVRKYFALKEKIEKLLEEE